MTNLDVTRDGSVRANLSLVRTDPTSPQCTTDQPKATRRPRPRLTPHLSMDQYIRLLALIEDGGGIVTIDEISRAMPLVQKPVSAVFDLCDAGILTADWQSAFDGDMRVWRVER